MVAVGDEAPDARHSSPGAQPRRPRQDRRRQGRAGYFGADRRKGWTREVGCGVRWNSGVTGRRRGRAGMCRCGWCEFGGRFPRRSRAGPDGRMKWRRQSGVDGKRGGGEGGDASCHHSLDDRTGGHGRAPQRQQNSFDRRASTRLRCFCNQMKHPFRRKPRHNARLGLRIRAALGIRSNAARRFAAS